MAIPSRQRWRRPPLAGFVLASAYVLGAVGPGELAGAVEIPTCPVAAAIAPYQQNGEILALPPAGEKSPLRILAIGSSSTQGVGASEPNHAYPARLAIELKTRWGLAADVRNAGIGGEVSDATLARLRRALATGWPQLTIWQVGTNDAVVGADEKRFEATLRLGIEAAREARTPLMLVDPQFLPGFKDMARYERFVSIIGRIGASEHVAVLSRYALMKGWAARGGRDFNSVLSADQFHMSDLGYACLARTLAEAMMGGGPAKGR